MFSTTTILSRDRYPVPADVILCDGQPKAAVLFVHGGGFVGGSKEQFSLIANDLEPLGVCSVSIDYRLSYPESVDDGIAAALWLKAVAAAHTIPEHRIFLCGGSPGANVAALAMARDPQMPQRGIWLNGIMDLLAFASTNPDEYPNLKQYFHTELTQTLLKEASPAYQMKPSMEWLFLHGSADAVIPLALVQQISQTLIRSGGRSAVDIFEGKHHAWFNSPEEGRDTAAHIACQLGLKGRNHHVCFYP